MDARLSAVMLVAAAIAGAAPAGAMEFAPLSAPGAMVAKGQVVEGDAGRLRAFLDRQQPRPSTVYLVSPGGKVTEGMAIGSLIRERGLATRVARGSDCASACVLTFLGGVIREVDPGGRIGVHMTSMMNVNSYIQKLKEILTKPNERLSVDDKISIIVALNEQSAARIANAETNYVLKMGVSLRLLEKATETLQIDINWLSRQEMRDYNVVNTE